jgi:hypothetical protein
MADGEDIIGTLCGLAGAVRSAGLVNDDWRPQGPQETAEFHRIDALPRRPFDPAAYEDLTPLYARPDGALTLQPIQNAMLWEAERANGLVANAAVGAGKTLTTLLLPDAMRARRAVLVVPASVKAQLIVEDIPFYSRHFALPLERITILTYEELSADEDLTRLCAVNPDVVIFDEAHLIRDPGTARGKRIKRFVRTHPATRYAFLSGTITTRSVMDYAHFLEWALRKNSPLPLQFHELVNWAATLDAGDNPAPDGVLAAWCRPGETARAAFQRRLAQTPGVVITTVQSCDTSLTIRAVCPPVPAAVRAALDTLATTWSYGADAYESAMEVYAAERQLAQGFYLRWDWPGGIEDDVWLIARAGWGRAVRQYLAHSNRPGMDSPRLLARAAAAGRWPDGREAWLAWDMVRGRRPPPIVVDWLDDYLVRYAVDWALGKRAAGRRAIVWFENEAMGRALMARGIPAYFGGDAGFLKLSAAAGAPVLACSRAAFHKGLNLQMYTAHLVLQCPANGAIWEQLLGRAHRQGQTQDVEFEVVMNTPAARAAWAQAVRDAEYAQETQGQPQKIIMATKEMAHGTEDDGN